MKSFTIPTTQAEMNDMLFSDFEGIRNDGREFIGMVEKVVKTVRGTLVTISFSQGEDGEYNKGYKSVYLEECKDWGVAYPEWR